MSRIVVRDRRNKRHGALSILFTWSRDKRGGKRLVLLLLLLLDAPVGCLATR